MTKSNQLYHYGIIGMKWGIRRFQNPDGSLTDEGRARYNKDQTIKKNKKLYRVSTSPLEFFDFDNMYTYVSTNKKDSDKWKNLFQRYGLDDLYELQFKTLKDVKIAGDETVGKTYIDKLMNDPKFAKQVIIDYKTLANNYSYFEDRLSDLSTRVDIDKDDNPIDYDEFSRTLGYHTKSSEDYRQTLRDNGYDGFVDMYGRTTSDNPLILLDAKNSIRLRSTKSAK